MTCITVVRLQHTCFDKCTVQAVTDEENELTEKLMRVVQLVRQTLSPQRSPQPHTVVRIPRAGHNPALTSI